VRKPFIVDAHIHTGASCAYYAEKPDAARYLELMDRLSIERAICSDMLSITRGLRHGLKAAERVFDESEGRIFYLGVYDPRSDAGRIGVLEKAAAKPGFLGVKIHPSFHKTTPESALYDEVWRFVRDHDLTLLAHSWSVSTYNPAQAYATPERFRHYADKFPDVRLVLAHAGGRGNGRAEAVRTANEYKNVYLDFAGDIFCFKYLETMLDIVPHNKLIFGSDYPMFDPRANLSRVLLSGIGETAMAQVLCNNAVTAYKMEKKC